MITWGYIAGFLDGDGWITVSKNKHASTKRYVIGLTQSKHELIAMRKIFRFIKRHGIRATFLERGTFKSTTPMLNIHVKHQKSVVKFIKFVMPFLLIKINKARECLSYTESRLKQRGVGLLDLKNRKKKYWKESEIKLLLKLQSQYNSNKTIGNILGRSSNSVAHKLLREGIIRSHRFPVNLPRCS